MENSPFLFEENYKVIRDSVIRFAHEIVESLITL